MVHGKYEETCGKEAGELARKKFPGPRNVDAMRKGALPMERRIVMIHQQPALKASTKSR